MATFFNSIKLSFQSKKRWLFSIFFLIILVVIGSFSYFEVKKYEDKIYPNIKIDDIEVGNLTKNQALNKVLSQKSAVIPHILEIHVDDINIASHSSDLNTKYDYESAIDQAFSWGRSNDWQFILKTIFDLFFEPKKFELNYVYDSEIINEMIADIKTRVDIEGASASALLAQSGVASSIKIDPGKDGRELSQEETLAQILYTLKSAKKILEKSEDNSIPMIKNQAVVASTSAALNQDQISSAREVVKKYVGRSIKFESDDKNMQDVFLILRDQEMISLLQPPHGYNISKIEDLLKTWQEKIDRPAQDAEFEFDPETLKVTKFKPHKDGLALQVEKTKQQIEEYLYFFENEKESKQDEVASLFVSSTSPKKTLSSTNDLGINELIAFGDSYYAGSIQTRVFNVSLTSERINLHIVPPGQEYSFNKALGEVSAKTGFKPAYIIRNGMTELGDGGGVCQVSTTLFRALLDGGLQITRRRPHSYRVGYYEQNSLIGLDATVYTGEVDLRFINDTPDHILISSQADSANRYMKVEIYGTNDGRTTEIKDYKTWDAKPALPPQYIPDPELPTGKLKQIDWSAPGLKASFVHVVKNSQGEIIREDTYFSNYRPWAAKYLQGV